MSSIQLSDADLQSILDFTSTLARRAGDLILEGSEAIAVSGDINEKKNSVDLVTEYDVRVEELVREEIRRTYPGFHLCVHVTAPREATTNIAAASGRSPTLRGSGRI